MSLRGHRRSDHPLLRNSQILQTFGGGCLHFCGNAAHQAENFLATEGLRAINTYTLHNLQGFRALKAKLEGRIVLFACDFAPISMRTISASCSTASP